MTLQAYTQRLHEKNVEEAIVSSFRGRKIDFLKPCVLRCSCPINVFGTKNDNTLFRAVVRSWTSALRPQDSGPVLDLPPAPVLGHVDATQ